MCVGIGAKGKGGGRWRVAARAVTCRPSRAVYLELESLPINFKSRRNLVACLSIQVVGRRSRVAHKL